MSGYSWDWSIFKQLADDDRLYYHWLIEGIYWTCTVAASAFILALVWGSILGIIRSTNNKPARILANSYVEIFRNIPLMVQLFLWFHVVPELFPAEVSTWLKQDLPSWLLAIIGLGLYTSSRISEHVYAAILTIPKGYTMAGLSLGLSNWQNYFHIRLPLAYQIIKPTLTSEAMNIVKNSSATFAVGVLETFFYARQMIEKTGQQYEVLIVIALIYVVLALSANLILTIAPPIIKQAKSLLFKNLKI